MESNKVFSRGKTMLLIVVVLLAEATSAQGIKQWFSQKQTQTEYLIRQIAALKIYTGYLEKGYRIVQGGLGTISDLKEGYFKLDQAFFDGLKLINPKVRHYSRVADIIRLNIQAVKLSDRAMKEARAGGRLHSDELNYANKVFGYLLDGCGALTDELISLLTPGEFELSDDERIRRIDRVYDRMNERYRFVNSFYDDLQTLQLQRDRELKDLKDVQKMNGQ